jgi:ribosomal protein S1
VFVDIGGVEGLIHISELSWGSRTKQIVSLGEIKVQVWTSLLNDAGLPWVSNS